MRWANLARCNAEDLRDGFWHGPDIEQTNVGRLSEQSYVLRTADRLAQDPSLVLAMLRDAFAGRFNTPFAAYVAEVRRRGVGVSALTNNWSSERELMARPELASLFDSVVSSCDVGLIKPDPEIYHLALRRLGRPAGDVVFVDDTFECVEAANTIGMQAVHFQTTEQAIETVDALLAMA